MEHLIETREGWWWPKHDVACWRYLSRRQDVPKNVSAYSEQKRVVVQAGGNAGMYVRMYEDIFDTVYTFEPDPLNFYCLTKHSSISIEFEFSKTKILLLMITTYTQVVDDKCEAVIV